MDSYSDLMNAQFQLAAYKNAMRSVRAFLSGHFLEKEIL